MAKREICHVNGDNAQNPSTKTQTSQYPIAVSALRHWTESFCYDKPVALVPIQEPMTLKPEANYPLDTSAVFHDHTENNPSELNRKYLKTWWNKWKAGPGLGTAFLFWTFNNCNRQSRCWVSPSPFQPLLSYLSGAWIKYFYWEEVYRIYQSLLITSGPKTLSDKFLKISPRYFLSSPYIAFFRYFRIQTIWYLQS